MSKTFLQYSGSWAKKLYPSGNKKKSTYTTSGCGPCSTGAIVYNINNSTTPLTTGNYSSSIGGATQGGATYHSTINKIFAHFGMIPKEVGTMSAFFSEMKKGDAWGVLLFRAGKGPTGIKFTSGGHYMSATAYKYENGRHYVYLRDSGKRGHTGWYHYGQFKGLIKKAWVIRKKSEPKKEPTPEKTPNQKAIEAAVAYAKSLAANNTYGYKHYDKTDHMCPICHPKTKVKGFNCIGLVAACFAHGAGDRTILNNCNKNNGSALGNNATLTEVTEASWRKKNGASWTMISSGSAKNSKSLDVSKLKAGDVLIGYDTKGKYKHTMIYIGDGKLVDAKSSGAKADQIGIRNYSSRATNMRISRAFRYTGGGKFEVQGK